MHFTNHRDRHGFSLLELLVAMTVLAVLLGILLTMVNGATQLWRASENRVDSYREARAALNVIASDLQSIFASENPDFFQWASEDDGFKTDVKIDDLVSGAAPVEMGDALFFLTSLSTAAQPYTGTSPAKGDLCAVGYFLAFGRPGLSGDSTCNLYRQLINSDTTFEAIQSTASGSGSPLLEDGTTKPGATITRDGLLARNIVEFRVDAKSYTRTAPDPVTTPSFPSPLSLSSTSTNPTRRRCQISSRSLSSRSMSRRPISSVQYPQVGRQIRDPLSAKRPDL